MANNKNIKVVIGVPVSDTDAMRALTAQAIGGAIIGAHKEGVDVIDMVLRRSCDIVSNRTWLVNYALNTDATHLLMVDADMIFPADTIPKLLAHKKPVVGVKYKKREFPVKWLYKRSEVIEGATEPTDTPFVVEYVGTGLMLIDLSIIKDLGKPKNEGERPTAWFSFGRDSQGALVMGEDVWFCNVVRDAGHQVWVDPTINIGHVGEYIY